jgi:hypothetical protein
MGSDKNKNPITAAESTNKLNITMGIKILSSFGINEDKELIIETINTIYKVAVNANKNGFFINLLYHKLS